jgi:hypothetical protein
MKSLKLPLSFLVALVFCAANILSYYLMPEESSMDDGSVYFGWPFSVYAYGGFWTHAVIIWTGIVGNIFVALCAHRVIRRLLQHLETQKSLQLGNSSHRSLSK